MARRVYGWLILAGLSLLPPVIKAIEVLDAMRTAGRDHAARLEMPDEGQHGTMPIVDIPTGVDLPFPNLGMHDVAIRAWGTDANLHPAYYQSASHSLFRR